MLAVSSCKQAMEDCICTKTFSVARPDREEKTMDMHIHDCYEMHFSISGGMQFLINNKFYSISPGDLFVINQYESHKLTYLDDSSHERIVINLFPEYVKILSSVQTDLNRCFCVRSADFQHKINLDQGQQSLFLSLVDRIQSAEGYGHDIIEKAAMMELLAMVNTLYLNQSNAVLFLNQPYNDQVDRILDYINQNISQQICIKALSDRFYISQSYLCRVFKKNTGTTISKYIIARRITIAKALLAGGSSVSEAYEGSGFTDYSNFYKAFSKAVGMPPKKYASIVGHF